MRALVLSLTVILPILAAGAARAQDAGLANPEYRALHEAGTRLHPDVNRAVDAFASRQEKPTVELLAAYEALLALGAKAAEAIGAADRALVGRIQRGLVQRGGEALAEARKGLDENDADKIRRGLNGMSNAWSIPLASHAPK
ncbi:MAG: hypothetical protein IPK81_14315 [Rhodospirillales bacterium]|nr:MAG: hypothetical protein IPK81_14315 [Rhodospirillales bacterium]